MQETVNEYAKLKQATPIVLLPVRLETRYRRRPGHVSADLLIRVYPDELELDGHEPGLTKQEYASARDYWRLEFSGDEAEAWARLVARHGAGRAEWIRRASWPTNHGTGADEPSLPPISSRESAWTRAVVARGMPRRWFAIAQCWDPASASHIELARGSSKAICRAPAVSSDPQRRGDPSADPATAWVVDFEAAEAAGMALRLHLAQGPVAIDRLLVFGVRTHESTSDSARELQTILDAHRYTRGAMVARQGTPTNNTMRARAGEATPRQSAPPTSVASEHSDGGRLARALGLPLTAFDGLRGTDRHEHRAARAMNNALWPIGVGYFLQSMATKVDALGEAAQTTWNGRQLSAARAHYMDWVHARGPFAALHLDETPYGVLPVSSLDEWMPEPKDFGGARLSQLLTDLRDQWRLAARGVVRLDPSGSHADDDIFAVLGTQASAAEVRVRFAYGPAFIRELFHRLRTHPAAFHTERQRLLSLFSGLAGELRDTRVAGMIFDQHCARWRRGLVATGAPVEAGTLTDDPAGNYIEMIRMATLDMLLASKARDGANTPLLHVLLDLAARREYLELALAFDRRDESRSVSDREMQALAAPHSRPRWLDPSEDGPIEPRMIDGRRYTDSDLAYSYAGRARFFRQCLRVLESQSSAELQRLMGETLDTGAHRLDAWITASVARRLDTLRVGGSATHLGCYGWVEQLEPRTRPRVAEHLLTPSLQHATTAAILRSGAQSGAGGGIAARLDLSSSRVGAAREVLAALREGLRLAEVLGSRFERHIMDQHPELRAELDKLRTEHPLARIVTKGATEPRPRVTPLDGLALARRKDWIDKRPAASRPSFAEAHRELAATLDAVGDLLMAESVHQLARGNAVGAGASLDALSRGAAAPAPDVAATPESGTSQLTRVCVVLPFVPAAEEPELAPSPGRLAAPGLDAWLGARFGPMKRFSCRVAASTESGSVEDFVSASKLDLGPLDLVAWIRREGRAATQTGVSRLIERTFRRARELPADARVELDLSSASEGGRPIAALIELATTAADFLTTTRPLVPADLELISSERAATLAPTTHKRFEWVRSAFEREFGALDRALLAGDPWAIESVLLRLIGFGLPVALDALGSDVKLFEAARSLIETMERQLEAARVADFEADPVAAFGLLLGRGFPATPTYSCPPELLERLLEPSSHGADSRWFQETAMARARVGTLRRLGVDARANGGERVRLERVVFDASGALVEPDLVPGEGDITLAMSRPAQERSDVLEGLFVDSWTEKLPANTAPMAVALQCDSPSAQAPNAILIAVPPRANEGWTVDRVARVLGETLDLAAIRMVDSERLGGLGQALPLHFIPTRNAQNPGDSVSLRSGLQGDPK